MDAEEAVARGPGRGSGSLPGPAPRRSASASPTVRQEAPPRSRPEHQAAAAGPPGGRGGGGGRGPGGLPPGRDRSAGVRGFLKKPSDGHHHRFTAGEMNPLREDQLAGVPQLPWRRIGIGIAVVVLLLVAVPPFRRAVSFGASRVILWAASPITPFVPDFRACPRRPRCWPPTARNWRPCRGGRRRQVVELGAIPGTSAGPCWPPRTPTSTPTPASNPGACSGPWSTALGPDPGREHDHPAAGQAELRRQPPDLPPQVQGGLLRQRAGGAYSKDELLERYLNQVYFGEGAYGIAAAQTFFGVPAAADPGPGGHAGREDPVAERARPPQGPGHGVQPGATRCCATWASTAGSGGAELESALASPLGLAPAAAGRGVRPGARLRGLRRPGGGRDRRPGLDTEEPRAAGVHRRLHDRDDGRPQGHRRRRGVGQGPAGRARRPDHRHRLRRAGNGAIRVLFGGLDTRPGVRPRQPGPCASRGRRSSPTSTWPC